MKKIYDLVKNHPLIEVLLNQRYAQINDSFKVNENGKLIGYKMQLVIDSHWKSFLFATYKNFAIYGFSVYRKKNIFMRFDDGIKKIQVPETVYEKNIQVSVDNHGEMELSRDNIDKGYILLKSLYHRGLVETDTIQSEVSSLLKAWEEVDQAKMLYDEAKKIALNPPIYVVCDKVDSDIYKLDYANEMTRRLLAKRDDTGYVNDDELKGAINKNGLIYIPKGYHISPTQPTVNVSEFIYQQLREECIELTERCLSAKHQFSSARYVTVSEIEKSRDVLRQMISNICSDLSNGLQVVWFAIYGVHVNINVKPRFDFSDTNNNLSDQLQKNNSEVESEPPEKKMKLDE